MKFQGFPDFFATFSIDEWSGFASWTAEQLKILEPLPPWAICAIVSTASIFLTEITSNTATAALFIPILCQLSVALKVNPYYLTVPATIGLGILEPRNFVPILCHLKFLGSRITSSLWDAV